MHNGDHIAPISEEDRALAERVRAGDIKAFEALYRAHAEGLIGFAYKVCGSRSAAQDSVSDTFVRIWEHRKDWYPKSSLRAYLYTAVRRRLMDQARSEKRADIRAASVVNDNSLVQQHIPVDEQVETAEELSALWRLIDSFPPLRRQVMYLRWSRGFAPEEIATVLGLNRNAVDKHLSRAMEAIRKVRGN